MTLALRYRKLSNVTRLFVRSYEANPTMNLLREMEKKILDHFPSLPIHVDFQEGSSKCSFSHLVVWGEIPNGIPIPEGFIEQSPLANEMWGD